jgi:bifunctional non-homologous end joining protein LigD
LSTSASGPLERYRAKRDFTVTSEPTGTGPAPPPGHRFVVQRHRARRLHYDLRLELDDVLVSWAVPRGPTLDPDVKRMAIHVEDHPLAYFDFEGLIPAGQYGGGDVIVWDWGTWHPLSQDPRADIEAGDLHFDLRGQKLAGRFVLVRRGTDRRGEWLLLKKRDDDARSGWDPEDHPLSVKSGRSNDEVREAPSASWSSTHTWAAPTEDELGRLDALGRTGTWRLGEHEMSMTDLDRVLFPASSGSVAVTKRDLIRHHALMAPAMLPYLWDRPVRLRRYPSGIDRTGSWQRAVPARTPGWISRWTDTDAGHGQADALLVLDSPAALAWVANRAAVELHPWTSPVRHPQQPTWALIDVDEGADCSFDDVLVVARLCRTALTYLGVDGRPVVTGSGGVQIWIPVADGYTFEATSAWVDSFCGAIGATVPQLVSRDREPAARADRVRLGGMQYASGTAMVAPFGVRAAPGAPVSVPVTWDELDEVDLRPDGWTIVDVDERLQHHGDPLVPLIGAQQRLPTL